MTSQTQKYPPLLALGFRPFFLGAASWAVAAALLWLLNGFGLSGRLVGFTDIQALLWHAHEMVFGFVFAVIAGFLLTASKNWSGYNPASGLSLAFLVGCWALARIFFYAGLLSLAGLLDVSFNFFLLFCFARVIFKAKLRRNIPLIALLSVPAGLNLSFYLGVFFNLSLDLAGLCEGALAVFTLFVLLITGRILPLFAPNAVQALHIMPSPRLDKFSLASGGLSVLLWGISAYLASPSAAFLCGLVFFLACGLNLKRFLMWKPFLAAKNTMLLALYLGYFWLILSFLSMGAETLGVVPRTFSAHVMALGSVSGAIAAMICRVTRGHTGRPIIAGKTEIFLFSMVNLAALLRLISALPAVTAQTSLYEALLMLSAGCFIAGFLAFLLRYAAWLITPRLDGKPG